MRDRGSLADYPEAARAEALAHFAQLRPHLEDGVPLTRLARQLAVSLRTLQRRVRAYRSARPGRPLPALAHPTRSPPYRPRTGPAH